MHYLLKNNETCSIKLSYGNLVLYSNLQVKNADEYIYEFLGGNSSLLFYQLIEEEQQDEFLEICENLQENEICRMFTRLKDCSQFYHMVDIQIQVKSGESAGEKLYYLDIYEVDRVERSYMASLQRMDKYRAIMGLADYIYFEYWPIQDQVVIYKYISHKAHTIYKGTAESWYTDAMKYAYKEDKNLFEINRMYDKMLSQTNNFDATIKTGILNEEHIFETLCFKVRYLGRYNEKLVVGVIQRKDINEIDIPYYLTSAGMDSVTGLLNKKASIDYSNDLLNKEKDKRHYMLLIDIDDFKNINDTFGHQMGDKAIILLSNTLSEVLGGRGIVSRFGGDEFYILTDNIKTEEQLRTFLKTVVMNVRNRVEAAMDMELSLSIGVSTFPDNSRNYDELLSLADRALYIAKEKGKNRYIIYRPELHDGLNIMGKIAGDMVSKGFLQTKTAREVIKQLLTYRESVLEEVLLKVCQTFELSGIQIFWGTDLKMKYSTGCDLMDQMDATYVKKAEYAALFDENGILAMNNIDNLMRVSEGLYRELSEKKCISYIQFLFPESKEPEGLICCNILNEKHKWNESEISHLYSIGSIIYEVLKYKQKDRLENGE